jgi:polyvinyl alcohol dehydrogenase (cytochrome)
MRLASLLLFFLAVSASAASAQTPQAADQEAESIYKARCASCHEAGVARAPNREGLRRLTPEAIGAALTLGSMREQGQELTLAQVQLLARTLGAPPPTAAAVNACTASDSAPLTKPFDQPNWNGWGANLAQHRFQPAAMARLSANDVPRLKLKWAFGFQGVNRAFAQPTVVGGRVFVGSAATAVYSLNANSGCQYWVFKPDAPVRTAITVSAGERGQWLAYFGDQRANAYAVDALTGALVWKRSVESFPGATITGAPTLADGTLYVATSSAEEVLGANPKYECCRFRGSSRFQKRRNPYARTHRVFSSGDRLARECGRHPQSISNAAWSTSPPETPTPILQAARPMRSWRSTSGRANCCGRGR